MNKKTDEIKRTQKKINKMPNWKIITIITGSALLLIIVGLFLSGYPQFEIAKIRCGHDPVIVDSSKGLFVSVGNTYVLPSPNDPFYKVNGLGTSYYCTEQKAQATGAVIYPFSNVATQRKEDSSGN